MQLQHQKTYKTHILKSPLNYHIDPDKAQVVYQQLGFDYANRVITPAIQESVKQVTARFNAEELITKRETENQIAEQIARL